MVGLDKLSVVSQKTDVTSTTETKCGGNKEFVSRYENQCKKNNSHPLKEVKVTGSSVKGTLDLVVDKIKFNDWAPLLKAVSSDRSLHSITFKSRVNGTPLEDIVTDRQARELKKGPVLLTFCVLHKFIDACVQCIEQSNSLRLFQLEKIPLTVHFIRPLADGVAGTCCLQKLLLVGCTLGDEGCQLVAEAVKKVPSIHTLDLSSNDITSKGAKSIANLIKFQGITRYNECWKHSLRCREVNTEIIPGLRRFSINDNHEVRDKGLRYIVEALYDDNWIKAIDMQNCGITDWGCSIVHKLLETNKEIVVFDLRKNDIINMAAIASMISILSAHTKGNDIVEFGWLDIANPSSGEDSSSGGASSSSYNLTYTNEKVAKYVETTVGCQTIRTAQSSTMVNDVRTNRQVTFQKGAKKSASMSALTFKQAPVRNVSSRESGFIVRKLVNSPASASSKQGSKTKYGSKLTRVSNDSRRSSRTKNSEGERSLVKCLANQGSHPVKKVADDEQILTDNLPRNKELSDSRLNDKVATTTVREHLMKTALEIERSHSNGSSSLIDNISLDSSNKIELALQKLFKSLNDANDKSETKRDINPTPQDLSTSLSRDDNHSDLNNLRKANRRTKETKQVCCLYYNRLEDGYVG